MSTIYPNPATNENLRRAKAAAETWRGVHDWAYNYWIHEIARIQSILQSADGIKEVSCTSTGDALSDDW